MNGRNDRAIPNWESARPIRPRLRLTLALLHTIPVPPQRWLTFIMFLFILKNRLGMDSSPWPDAARGDAMLERTIKLQKLEVLIIDEELALPKSVGGRAVRALADELKSRDIEVVEAVSYDDGRSVFTSDA